MYKCKHFQSHELVPPEVYARYASKDEIYDLFDENALRILDLIRDWAGVPMTVNNWFWAGSRRYSGLRELNCPIGAKNSAHKTGKAFDIITPRLTAQHLWATIEAHTNELPCKIRIERTYKGKFITWLHFDTAAKLGQTDKIYYFSA